MMESETFALASILLILDVSSLLSILPFVTYHLLFLIPSHSCRLPWVMMAEVSLTGVILSEASQRFVFLLTSYTYYPDGLQGRTSGQGKPDTRYVVLLRSLQGTWRLYKSMRSYSLK